MSQDAAEDDQARRFLTTLVEHLAETEAALRDADTRAAHARKWNRHSHATAFENHSQELREERAEIQRQIRNLRRWLTMPNDLAVG